ncbi:MAG: hypothetical protein RR483_00690 [Clostridia bacterium]
MKKAILIATVILTIMVLISSCKSDGKNEENSSKKPVNYLSNEEQSNDISSDSYMSNGGEKTSFDKNSFFLEENEYPHSLEDQQSLIITENALKNFSCSKIDKSYTTAINKAIKNYKNNYSSEENYTIKYSFTVPHIICKLDSKKAYNYTSFQNYLFKDLKFSSINVKDNITQHTLWTTFKNNVSSNKNNINNFEIDGMLCVNNYVPFSSDLMKIKNFNFLEKELNDSIIDISFFIFMNYKSLDIIPLTTETNDTYALIKGKKSDYIVSLVYDDYYLFYCRNYINNSSDYFSTILPSFSDALRYNEDKKQWVEIYKKTFANEFFTVEQAEQYLKDKKYIYTIAQFIEHCKKYNLNNIPENIQKALKDYKITLP